MTVIDVHAHVFPRLGRADGRVLADEDEPWLRVHGDGTGMMMSGDGEYRPVEEGLWDPRAGSPTWTPSASTCRPCRPPR